MDGNGQADVGSYAWVQSRILQNLEASGMDPDHLEALRQKVAGVRGILDTFRAWRQQVGDSGRYSVKGLKEAEEAEAAKAAGEIRRILATSCCIREPSIRI